MAADPHPPIINCTHEALHLMENYHAHHEGDLWSGEYLECVEHYAVDQGLPDRAIRLALEQLLELYRR